MRNTKPLFAGLAGLILLFTASCSLLGPKAAAPGRFEESLFNTTNVPMVTVHEMTHVVNVTNEIPVYVQRPVLVFQTNEFEQPVLVTNTVTATNWVERVSQQTNVTPAGTTVQVPQLTGPSSTAQTSQTVISGIAGLFGYGGIATILLSGVGHWYQNKRNKALRASYTGATSTVGTANLISSSFAQSEQVLLEVLQQTPQGKTILPMVQNFLSQHRFETGVLQQVAQLVDDNVDLPAAKEAAQAIIEASKQLAKT